MKKITEEWLKAAADDLSVIARIISDDHLSHMVAFHSQQAIEKSFKAVMEEYELAPIRIHNLVRLLDVISAYAKVEIDIILLEKLDKLYVDARYPADMGLLPYGKPTQEDASEFNRAAQSVYLTLKSYLEKIA